MFVFLLPKPVDSVRLISFYGQSIYKWPGLLLKQPIVDLVKHVEAHLRLWDCHGELRWLHVHNYLQPPNSFKLYSVVLN